MKKNLIALALVAVSAMAHADHRPNFDRNKDAPPCPMMSHEKDGQRDAHFAKLKAKLALTPAQENAWAKFVDTAPKPMKHDAMKTPMTAPEHLEGMVKHHEDMLATMKDHLAATKALYATMTKDQQSTFDSEANRMANRMHGKDRKGEKVRGEMPNHDMHHHHMPPPAAPR